MASTSLRSIVRFQLYYWNFAFKRGAKEFLWHFLSHIQHRVKSISEVTNANAIRIQRETNMGRRNIGFSERRRFFLKIVRICPSRPFGWPIRLEFRTVQVTTTWSRHKIPQRGQPKHPFNWSQSENWLFSSSRSRSNLSQSWLTITCGSWWIRSMNFVHRRGLTCWPIRLWSWQKPFWANRFWHKFKAIYSLNIPDNLQYRNAPNSGPPIRMRYKVRRLRKAAKSALD